MADTGGTPSTPQRKSGRRSWFTPGKTASSVKFEIESFCTPTKKPDVSSNIETLTLSHFGKPPRLDFGNIVVGATKKCQLRLENPHEQDQRVKIEKFPFKKNFFVATSEFVVPAEDKVIIDISWNPTEEGAARCMALFLVDGAYRLQAIMFGVAEEPPKPKKKRGVVTRPTSILAMKNKKAFSSVKKKSPPDGKKKRSPGSGKRRSGKENSPQVMPPSLPHHAVNDVVHSQLVQGPLCAKLDVQTDRSSMTPRKMRRSVTYTQVQTPLRSSEAATSKETPPPVVSSVASDITAVLDTPTAVFGPTHSDLTSIDTPMRVSSALFNDITTVVNTPVHVFGPAKTSSVCEDTPMRAFPAKANDITIALSSPSVVSDKVMCSTLTSCQDTPFRVVSSASDNLEQSTLTRSALYVPTSPSSKSVSTLVVSPVHVFNTPKKPLVWASYGRDRSPLCEVEPSTQISDESVHSLYDRDSNQLTTVVSSPKTAFDTPNTGVAPAKNMLLAELDTPMCMALSPKSILQNHAAQGNMSAAGTPPHVSPDSFLMDSVKRAHALKQIPSPSGVLSDQKSHNAVIRQLDSVKSNLLETTFRSSKQGFPIMTPEQMPTPRRETVIVSSPKLVRQPPMVPVPFVANNWNGKGKIFPEITDTPSPRRETVIVDKPKQVFAARLFACQTAEVSPRRETYTANQNRPVVSRIKSRSPLVSRQDVVPVEAQIQEESDTASASQSAESLVCVEVPKTIPNPRQVNSMTVVKEPKSVSPILDDGRTVNRKSPKNLFGSGDSKSCDQMQESNEDAVPITDTVESESLNVETVKVEEDLMVKPTKSVDPVDSAQSNELVCATTPSAASAQFNPKMESAHKSTESWLISNDRRFRQEDFQVKKSAVTARLTAKRTHSQTRATKEDGKKVVDTSASKKIKASVEETDVKDRSLTRTQKLRIQAAGGSIKSAAKTEKASKKKAAVKGVAQSRLLLNRKANTALPKHPMPFASKNMYYDERWIEKQDRGFTKWLNFVLTPQDLDMCMTAHKPTKIDAGSLSIECGRTDTTLAPSKETLSFRAYSARRSMNRLRRAACKLFQSEPVVRVVQRVEAEVDVGRLSVRRDRKLRADLGIKQALLDMILSYNPLWLRIGLETIYGELLPVQSNMDVVGISRFILTRLLGNPDIAASYAHPTVPHSYKDGYDETVARYTLKKFLILVFFLDSAKLTRLIDHDPCLFCKDADFKTSRDLLLEFSRNYLSGVGDITKHLSYMGYVTSHRQTALEEYDFAVTKLAVDLRDGMRLARVVELLTHDWTLSRSLRVPAISRLQKIHNVDVALKALQGRGLDLSLAKGGAVTAKDIVDGHREKTHTLLWQLIFNFQVELMLDVNQLKEEISFLQSSLDIQHQMETLCSVPNSGRQQTDCPDLYYRSEKLSLLLKWCQSVCAYYNMKIDNFTVSFSDGRALCYLLHHYHPSLLPLSAIFKQTTQTIPAAADDADDSGDDSFNSTWKMAFSPTTGKPTEYQQLLANERENFKALYDKVSELGGVPVMVKSSDMCGTIPDEKVVITYVSYLCARLLDIRVETRAARTIQMAYRCHLVKKRREQLKVENEAAKILQNVARAFLDKCQKRRKENAAILIQCCWRRSVARLRAERVRVQQEYEEQLAAAVKIQSRVKMFLARRSYLKEKAAAVKIQSWWRSSQARGRYKRIQASTIVIQKTFQAWFQGRQAREEFLNLRNGVLMIQKVWRGVLARKHVEGLKRTAQLCRAAILIQSWYRMCQVRRNYQNLRCGVVKAQALWRARVNSTAFQVQRQSAVCIQRWYRNVIMCRHQRKLYLSMLHDIIVVQSLCRGWLERRQLQRSHVAATVLQSAYRCVLERKRYQQLRMACVVIQRRLRTTLQANTCRNSFLEQRRACITLQAHVRSWLCRRRLCRQHAAATVIQSVCRMRLATAKYQQLKHATLVIQSRFRAKCMACAARNQYSLLKRAAIVLQSSVRGWWCRARLQRERHAAVRIQSAYRRYRALAEYQEMRQAAIVIQSRFRAWQLSKLQWLEYNIQRGASITIQAAWRKHVCQQRFAKIRKAAICIQSHVRSMLARKDYQLMRNATIIIQRRLRATLLAKEQSHHYQIVLGAIVTIQAWVRGHAARGELQKWRRAAIVLQAQARKLIAVGRYNALKNATSVIQAYYRNKMIAKYERSRYLQLKNAAIQIQAAYRRKTQREAFLRAKHAATVLQSAYRGYAVRLNLARRASAARIIQTRWRSTQMMRQVQLNYLVHKGAAIVIQSVYRGYIAKKSYQETRTAVIRLQALVRGRVTRRCYENVRTAAQVIQQRWRATLLKRSLLRDFQDKKRAVLIIQSYVRGFMARRSYGRTLKAVTLIQSHVRRLVARQRYSLVRQAVATIQTRWRATLAMRGQQLEYLICKGAAIVIQARFKAYMAQRAYQTTRTAIICLQTHARRRMAQREFKRLKMAASVIQNRWRMTLLQRSTQKEFAEKKRAAVTIQSAFRGYCVRKQYRKDRIALVRLQAMARGAIARRQYLRFQKAVAVLQTRWRSTISSRQTRLEFLISKGAAIMIQSCFKGYLARRHYHLQRRAIVDIQARVRGKMARDSYTAKRNAVSLLQKRWRETLLQRSVRLEYLAQKSAAVCVQSAWRGYLERRAYLQSRDHIIMLQSRVRGATVRRGYLSLCSYVRLIQLRWRATLLQRKVQREYQVALGAAITIQAYIRGYLARCQLKRYHAATAIQSYYRMYVCRQQFLHSKMAITKLQAHVRGKCQRRVFLKQKAAVTTLQSYARAAIIGRKTRRRFLIAVGAAITVQAWYRGHVARKLAINMKAARTIQAVYRGYRERLRFQKTKACIVRLQANIRRTLAQKQYDILRTQAAAARVIQKCYRNHVEQKAEEERRRVRGAQLARITQVAKNHLNVVRIQRAFRNYRAMKVARERLQTIVKLQRWVRARLERRRYLRLRQAALTLQSAARRMLVRRTSAAIVIQKHARVLLAKQRLTRWKWAIVTIQSHWRGVTLRRSIKSKKVIQARKRVQAATREATEDKKLCNRTTSALDYLLCYKHLSYILDALVNLDVATRLSARCCERMVEGNAVRVIFTLIRSCNRSLPHMEIIKYSVNVLLNLAKYEKTVSAVYECPDSIDTLLELMQIYREKGVDIFCKTSLLVALLSNDTERRAVILSLPKVADRVRSIHTLTLRKFKMEEKRQSVKSKLASSRTMTTPATPGHTRRVQPEWVMRRDKVNSVICPLVAVNYLLSALQLGPK